MHNLTYQERARFAYADGNTELAEALEQLAEWEAENERLTDRVWDLEQELERSIAALDYFINDEGQCDIDALESAKTALKVTT